MTPAILQPAPVRQSKGLHVTLWIVQVLLALTFGFPGSMKVSQPNRSARAKLLLGQRGSSMAGPIYWRV
jgi:hypothetical protein